MGSAQIQIRPAQAEDLQPVWELNQKNVPMVGDVKIDWFVQYLQNAELFLIATVNDAFAGYLVGMNPQTDYKSENFLWFKSRYPDFMYVDRLAVADEFQGLGVGKALYDYTVVAAKAKARGLVTCEVNVRPANDKSYGFHQKLGFQEVGQQETKGGTIRVAMLAKSLA